MLATTGGAIEDVKVRLWKAEAIFAQLSAHTLCVQLFHIGVIKKS
jgi:hypothetical protein